MIEDYDILFSVSVQRSHNYDFFSHNYYSMEGDLRTKGSQVKQVFGHDSGRGILTSIKHVLITINK